MIGPLHFALPIALAALAAAPLLAVAAWYEARRRRQADARYGGAATLRRGRGRTRGVVRATLLIGAVVLLALALARPRWGTALVLVERRGIDVAIVLDVSRSMTAMDTPPSRAAAAAFGLRGLLSHLTGNRVGLVTFAGGAFTRSPLSLDLGAVSSLVTRAQGDAPLVVGGTDLRTAIDHALSLLDVADPAHAQAIVLVSDGEDLGSDIAGAVQRARERDVPIYTVLAGTTTPTALPASSGGTELTRGDPATLERIASESGGGSRDLASIAGLAVEFRQLRQTRFDAATERVPVDRFPWFVAAALALLATHALIPASRETRALPLPRRGLAGLGGAALLLLAGCGGTALYRHVQAGNHEYGAQRYEPALAAYGAAAALAPDDPAITYNRANTLYQLGRMDEAAATAALALAATKDDALRLRLHYTTGNTAARAGDLERARAAYEAVLRLDPGDRDAKANLELVLRVLDPPAPPPPEEGEERPTPTPGQQPGATPTPAPGQGDATQPPGQATPAAADGPPDDPGGATLSAEEARAALQRALAQLGPEITVEQAREILALARQANELERLPARGGGGVPPR